MGEEQRARDFATRRDVLVAGSCFGGAALGGLAAAFNVPHTLPQGGLASLVPPRFDGWAVASLDGVIISDDAADLRGPYDDLLARVYQADGSPPIALLVAYGGSQINVQIHRPEICYPSAGYVVGDRHVMPLHFAALSPIPATIILAQSPLRTEQVLYWTRIGGSFPTTGAEQRWAIARENLAARVPDGVLVRLSTPVLDRIYALQLFTAFVSALFAASSPTAKRLLFGIAG